MAKIELIARPMNFPECVNKAIDVATRLKIYHIYILMTLDDGSRFALSGFPGDTPGLINMFVDNIKVLNLEYNPTHFDWDLNAGDPSSKHYKRLMMEDDEARVLNAYMKMVDAAEKINNDEVGCSLPKSVDLPNLEIGGPNTVCINSNTVVCHLIMILDLMTKCPLPILPENGVVPCYNGLSENLLLTKDKLEEFVKLFAEYCAPELKEKTVEWAKDIINIKTRYQEGISNKIQQELSELKEKNSFIAAEINLMRDELSKVKNPEIRALKEKVIELFSKATYFQAMQVQQNLIEWISKNRENKEVINDLMQKVQQDLMEWMFKDRENKEVINDLMQKVTEESMTTDTPTFAKGGEQLTIITTLKTIELLQEVLETNDLINLTAIRNSMVEDLKLEFDSLDLSDSLYETSSEDSATALYGGGAVAGEL